MIANIKSTHDSEPIARKRMRKGTRSCMQCRSRKIRCIFPNHSSLCNSCSNHGRQCTEQTFADVRTGRFDKRVGLKERVRDLENLVNQLLEKGGDEAQKVKSSKQYLRKYTDAGVLSPPESSLDRAAVEKHPLESPSICDLSGAPLNDIATESYDSTEDVDSPNAAKSSFENAPFVSLFDNAIIRHDRTDTSEISEPLTNPSSNNPGRAPKGKVCKLLEDLRALIPPERDLNIIMNRVAHISPIWYAVLMEYHLVPGANSLQDAIYTLLRSNRPTDICKAFITLTLMIQQRPPSDSDRDIKLSDGTEVKGLISRYLTIVESLFFAGDNNLMGSLDGLECVLMMTKFFTNDGRPRRAWLYFQRGLSEARMLGFYRPASWKTSPDPNIGQRRERLWWTMFIGDRYLSLMLGLPHSIFDSHVGVDNLNFGEMDALSASGSLVTPYSYGLKLGVIAGHIIDRNQNPNPATASCYTYTMKIDAELHALSCSMPEKWWQFSSESPDVDTYKDLTLKELYNLTHAQIWHHECSLALHMPFMMKSANDPASQGRYSYSRQAALKAARSLIRVHLHLRLRKEFSYMVCQVVDFQVFTSTLLLLLDVFGKSGNRKNSLTPALSDRETLEDQTLTKAAASMLKRLALESNAKNNVSAQAVKVLQTLGSVFYACNETGIDNRTRRIVIPYFGAITIKPSTDLPNGRNADQTRHKQTTVAENQSPSSSDIQATKILQALGNQNGSYGSLEDASGNELQGAKIHAFGSPVNNSVVFDNFVTPHSVLTTGGYPLSGSGQGQEESSSQTSSGPSLSPGLNIFNNDDYAVFGADSLPPPAAAGTGELDACIWNDGAWQSMMSQDLSMDLDADWNWFPVGGGTEDVSLRPCEG